MKRGKNQSKPKTQYENVEKKGPKKLNGVTVVMSMIPIIISVASLIISWLSYETAQELEPLQYYLKPQITSYNNGIMRTEVEIMVTSGAVGAVRVIDYKNGEISDIANNLGGVIDKSSTKSERTFEFEFLCDREYEEYIMTEYLIINGRDGSKNIGMILYHVNLNGVSAEYYSTEDLILSELDPSKKEYKNVFINYRELIELLRENMEL